MSIVAKQVGQDYLDGLTADAVPFGGRTGLPDDIFAPYSAAHQARSLDRLGADVEAAPEQDEMSALDEAVDRFVCRRAATFPRGWKIEPELSHTWKGGKRADCWRVFVFTATCSVGLGQGHDTLKAATEAAEADLPPGARAELEAFRLKQGEFSAAHDADCETDFGGRAA